MWTRGLISSAFLRLKTMRTNSAPVHLPNYWIRGPGGKATEPRITIRLPSPTGSFLRQHCRNLLRLLVFLIARIVRRIGISVRPLWLRVSAGMHNS
jgi:hypothetical protein